MGSRAKQEKRERNKAYAERFPPISRKQRKEIKQATRHHRA